MRAAIASRLAASPNWRPLVTALVLIALAGCGSKPTRTTSSSPADSPRGGGYYQDDGPGRDPPANLDQIPDAVPRWEPLHRFANRPYTVLGRDYVPATELKAYRQRGMASWYGRKFHRQKTSIGETYDMYAMTAAHPTLPLPSYVRVTHLANGRSVVVRVNDRGPFLHDRIIDLSYAAAQKLGYVGQGSARVEVEALIPEGGGLMATRRPPIAATLAGAAAPAPTAVLPAPARSVDPLPLRFEGNNVYLQLGAFTSFDNAENFLTLVEFQLAGESNPIPGTPIPSTSYTPRVRSRDNLFRVELGPYASGDDAQRAARELEARFGVVPSAHAR